MPAAPATLSLTRRLPLFLGRQRRRGEWAVQPPFRLSLPSPASQNGLGPIDQRDLPLVVQTGFFGHIT